MNRPALSEPEQGHVVQRWFLGTEHGGRGDLDEQHLNEELYSGGEEMAGITEGAAFFEAEAGVNVRQHAVCLGVAAKGATTEGFDVGEVDLGPDGGTGVGEFLASADDLGFGEPGDEHRDVALADVVGGAERGEGVEEVFVMIEGDAEGSAGCQFMAAHVLSLAWRLAHWPRRRLSRSRGDPCRRRPARAARPSL